MAKGFKTGGRSRNTPNKLTKKIKTTLSMIVTQELELLPERINRLSEVDKVTVLLKLLPFILPKPSEEIDLAIVNSETPPPLIINITPLQDEEKFPSDESKIDLRRDPRYYKEKTKDS